MHFFYFSSIIIIAVAWTLTTAIIYIHSNTMIRQWAIFPGADLYGSESLMGRFGKVCLLPQKILSDMVFFVLSLFAFVRFIYGTHKSKCRFSTVAYENPKLTNYFHLQSVYRVVCSNFYMRIPNNNIIIIVVIERL